MLYVVASSPFEAVLEAGNTGLVGTLAVKIIDNDGGTTIASTTTNITESGTSGLYIWNSPVAPAVLGQYTIMWSTDGTYAPDTVTSEELVVIAAGAGALPAIPVPDDDTGLAAGPCTAWTSVDDVRDCCTDDELASSDTTLIDAAIVATSELLYEASGSRFSGLCQRTVRPCGEPGLCGVQVLSRGHLVGWDGSFWGGYNCGCQPLSRVKLAGSVREIVEVKIDGVVVGESLYEVRERRWLIRTDGGLWPRCQSDGLPDTEEGTFSVTYTYGRAVPTSGQRAAAQLACEVFKSCSGAGECALPIGVSRVTRQGITIERTFMHLDKNGWRTGLATVDLFLNIVNPRGLARRGTFWSPSSRARYARPTP